MWGCVSLVCLTAAGIYLLVPGWRTWPNDGYLGLLIAVLVGGTAVPTVYGSGYSPSFYRVSSGGLTARYGRSSSSNEHLVPWGDVYLVLHQKEGIYLSFRLPGDPEPRETTWAGRQVAIPNPRARSVKIPDGEWDEVRAHLSPKVLEELEWRKAHRPFGPPGETRSSGVF